MEKVVENPIDLLDAQTHISKELLNFTKSASLKCALELGIQEVIQKHGKPINLSELTSSLPINPSKSHHIYRLMRHLVNAGFLAEDKDGCNALTPVTRVLLNDEPLNTRPLVYLIHDPIMMKPWNFLTEWFQNDDHSPFNTAHSRSLWDFNARDPGFRKLFNEAMAGESQLTTEVLVTECKYVFEGLKSLVDVGGGTGTVARAIAKTFPGLMCTVFDLPHVVANQEETENLDFVAGNMLEKIPSTNAIMLKIEISFLAQTYFFFFFPTFNEFLLYS
ncbi:hypothetical protein ACH5RR_028685 [Cinchona calisaya]|uniref:Uncharacterized protein n=1 Tax=Cinchona calisaya TaxID=153742 RepID=A0ABD2YRB3_9GENT